MGLAFRNRTMIRILSCIFCFGFAVTLLCCSDDRAGPTEGIAPPDSAYDPNAYPAEFLLDIAITEAKTIDPGAWLTRLEYNNGDRELKFRSARFVFHSPQLKSRGVNPNAIEIRIKNGEITEIKKLPDKRMDGPKIKVHPRKVFENALQGDLERLFQKYRNVRLYMELKPYEGDERFIPEKSEWIWRVMGIGPAVTGVVE